MGTSKVTWWVKILAKRPWLVLIAVAVFSISTIITAFVSNAIPDFTDPTLGFEARGTHIGQRLTAWKNLIEQSTSSKGILVSNPKELLQQPAIFKNSHNKRRQNKTESAAAKRKNQLRKKMKLEDKITNIKLNQIHFTDSEILTNSQNDTTESNGANSSSTIIFGTNQSFSNEEKMKKFLNTNKKWDELRKTKRPKQILFHTTDEGFFCDSPRPEYSHFVIERNNHYLQKSVLTLEALRGICDLHYIFSASEQYKKICQTKMSNSLTKECCEPWSLASYVVLLSNKTSCSQIEENDVQILKDLLFKCYPFYNNLKLLSDCSDSQCQVPPECAVHNAAYNILHYILSSNYNNNETNNDHLSLIFLPIAQSTKSLSYFHDLKMRTLKNQQVKVVGMDMGLKNALFDECLINDSWQIALGGLFVVVCMWLYTSSIFITIMTILAIIFSLGIAYFVYTIVFHLNFFPFMNLLALVVVVGIGADDAFIYVKIWKCVLNTHLKSSSVPLAAQNSIIPSQIDTLIYAISNTWSHAVISMLVTSLTTAAAFYASYSSSITAVKCFGIFAGTAVLTNYILMITWLPAAISIHERYKLSRKVKKNEIQKNMLQTYFKRITKICKQGENFIKTVVIKMPVVFVVVLGLIGVFSGVIVLYQPKLQLPSSPEFKLFVANHPFEMYESKYKNNFWFEKTSTGSFKLPLRFVWGIKPVDNGNPLDPISRGNLQLDLTFNVSAPASQVWLLHFCQTLKEQSFTSVNSGLLLPNCFMENFITWMSRRCIDDMSGVNRKPCCEESTFPYSTEIFELCLPDSISSLYETPRQYFVPGVAGPKFSRRQAVQYANETIISEVLAIVIEYDSSQFQYAMSFRETADFVAAVETWFDKMLNTAPDGMKNGWFTSDLDFYDLQETLSSGIVYAIGMPMIVALIVLFFATLNILISMFAILTVTLTIFTTVAILIGLGWQLNVLESVAVTIAVGLSVDFSLHYSVHYKLSPEHDRKSCVKFSLTRMIEPTLWAALTTLMAGIFMLPSKVLAYIQIGVFLVIIMTTSWIYATFFLMSLLRLCGPQHGFCQYEFPWKNKQKTDNTRSCNNTKPFDHMNKTHSIVSEQLTSESHELDSLTSTSVIRSLEHHSNTFCNEHLAKQKKHSYPSENSLSIGSIVTVLPDD